MVYIITEPCIGVKDGACLDACPVDCIHPMRNQQGFAEAKMLYIDPIECIDCAACEPVCPVNAIFEQSEVPEKWKSYIKINADYLKK